MEYDDNCVLRLFQAIVTQALIDATAPLGNEPKFKMLEAA